MVARSSWRGSISFGLVNIPIKLYTATNKREFVFNQLCQNGHRIRYKKWCPAEEREVPYSEIKKGYEVTKNKESLVALRPYQRGLVMHILNYLDEIKPVDEIPEMGDKKVKLDAQEMSLGKLLVEKYRKKEFDIGEYSDTYVQELRKLID